MDSSSKDAADFQIFRTVLMYCITIIVLPVITFFSSKVLFIDVFGLSDVPSNVYSAISSIVVLHFALGLYIYKAYNDSKTEPLVKQD